MPQSPRFTIYDVMNAKGVFEANPANAGARDGQGETTYKGPVPYPKMLYHPKGEERITVPGEVIVTPMGAKVLGEQRELIYKIVTNFEQEEKLLNAGWHTHPAAALAAAGKVAPPTGAAHTIAELEMQIEQLKAQKAALEPPKAGPLSKALPTGATP